jgi:hypothetical protein
MGPLRHLVRLSVVGRMTVTSKQILPRDGH